jgi:hypothetical protein
VSAGLHELLVELAVAVHKRAIYPEGHPILRGASEGVHQHLEQLLREDPVVSIGVADRSLIVGGAPSSSEHPLLSEFASRLADHAVGAIRFLPGISREELHGFITEAAAPADGESGPLGFRRDVSWNCVAIEPMAFEHLGLLADGASVPGSIETTWRAMATVALRGAQLGDVAVDPATVAQAIEGAVEEEESFGDAIIERLAEMLRDPSGQRPGGTGNIRLEELIGRLSPAVREKLLRVAGPERGRALVLSAANRLSASAVLELFRAAVGADAVSVSDAMLRLLQKLSREATTVPEVSRTADRVLRAAIRRVLHGWVLDNPNPEMYERALNEAAESVPAHHADRRRDVVEPERIIDLAVETGTVAPAVDTALGRLVMRDGLPAAIERLNGYAESDVRERLMDRLLNEGSFREYLHRDTLDLVLLRHAVDRMRAAAAVPLVDALERRGENDASALCELLVRVGWDALEPLGDCLARVSPRVLRHLMTVFNDLEAWPPQSDPRQFTHHADATVRREALRFMLADPGQKDAALLAALRDPDGRVFTFGLGSLGRDCPPACARELMRRYNDESMNADQRVRIIRAAGQRGSQDVLQWLTPLVLTHRWVIGTPKLKKPTQESVAAMAAIAAHFAGSPAAAEVLQLAERSKHPEYRQTVLRRPRPVPI